MNKRDAVLSLINDPTPSNFIPAAFFLHFDPSCHQGQAAIDKHLEFFRATGMDFVKIQYEQTPPHIPLFTKPADWVKTPRVSEDYFEATTHTVEGLVKAAKSEALVVLTIYSPFMWARKLAPSDEDLVAQMRENPVAVSKGLEILTENVLTLVKACQRAGVDGFYVSTQGGETNRFKGTDIFEKTIKPTDLAIWEQVKKDPFNILHVCDFNGTYDDLSPFLDYPGQVVNVSQKVAGQTISSKQIAKMFGRPFMGGLERTSTIATGSLEEVRQASMNVLAEAPERFILGADCTVPNETSWENLKAAIDTAHGFRK